MSGRFFDARMGFEEESPSIYYFLFIIDYWACLRRDERGQLKVSRNFGVERSAGIEYAGRRILIR